ncbi:hypothetical protein D3C73_1191170 [compost metagenome]
MRLVHAAYFAPPAAFFVPLPVASVCPAAASPHPIIEEEEHYSNRSFYRIVYCTHQ